MQIYHKLKSLLTLSERWKIFLFVNMMIISMVLETMGLGSVLSSVALMTQSNIVKDYPRLEPLLRFFNYPERTKLITWGFSILITIYFAKTVFVILMNWKRNEFIFGIQANLSNRLFKGYIEQPWAFHLQRNSAQLIHNIMSEVSVFSMIVLQSGLMLLSEGLVFLGISAVLLVVEPLGTIVVLSFLSVAVFIFHRFIRYRVSRWGKMRQVFDTSRLQCLQQGLGGAKDVKLLGRESDFINQYHQLNLASLRINQKQSVLTEVPRLMLELLLVVSMACIIISMLAQGESTEMLIPTMGLFAAAAFRLIPSVNRMLGAMQSLRYGYPSLQTLYDEIRLTMENAGTKKNGNITFNNTIVLKHISYKYNNAKHPALDNISFLIPQGASIGFIGKSGAGKSTLVDVILGLLTPEKGVILVDDVDIQSQLRAWQDHIGYVPQAIFLTDDTLRRNVAFGLPDEEINDEAVRQAIKAAHLSEFIEGLPEGINTFVGERGVRLSGGQRQRLGIARALYHNPQILVLDEATSSLDTAIESEVMRDINALQGEKTLIIVAHRLSTLEKCDWVYRLDQGRIVDSGSFVEVINRDNVQTEREEDINEVSIELLQTSN